ncbi:holin [Mycobacterium phage SirDuracell]|uniref:Holin n=24 Tax=Viruses TaxID=10239 RepID=Q857X8_9CAUD|nr:holin [Mycobacterium phage Cjw1]YP_002014354.1 holin [Mycobacterium phage Porky]YP_002014502.1 holin [Mycobacterium phage Kostya]YP_008051513.1 holin [Mycobacterium phage Murphy]YP_008051658.1 holin [Mycobacterium phage Dumbo]YP_008051969.1 holin [Mycobacterium phage Phrux]YP_008052206.1 holin [Mycobacterium phage Phaux]YP_008409427.1 holin [Mycobacterium phage DrDrey]YP_008410050.1 holin [Mycobacterium phage Contagion]YP_008430549.1 holin [Mycobacterium phage Goku]YP_008531110.1 holin
MDKIRQYYYLAAAAIAGLIPILNILHVLSDDQILSVNQIIASIGSLIGAAGVGTAGVILGKQRKEGVLEKLDPADKVVTGIQEAVTAAAHANDQLDRVKEVVNTLNPGTVIGNLVEQAIAAAARPRV